MANQNLTITYYLVLQVITWHQHGTFSIKTQIQYHKIIHSEWTRQLVLLWQEIDSFRSIKIGNLALFTVKINPSFFMFKMQKELKTAKFMSSTECSPPTLMSEWNPLILYFWYILNKNEIFMHSGLEIIYNTV